jgi:hypothetical protein
MSEAGGRRQDVVGKQLLPQVHAPMTFAVVRGARVLGIGIDGCDQSPWCPSILPPFQPRGPLRKTERPVRTA